MDYVRIGKLVEKTKQVKPDELGRTHFTYVDISSIDRELKVISEAQYLPVDEAPSRARKSIENKDVIVSTVRPNLNAVALVTKEYHQEIASTGFCVLRPIPECLDEHYLFYLTQTSDFVDYLVRIATGASYPAVSDSDILRFEIPLPPLDEQKRIAAILEEADHARRTRRFTQSVSDTFLQEVFVEMFGDVLDDPNQSTELSELVRITGGGTPSRSVLEYFQGTIPWVTAKDMKSNYIHDAEEHVTPEAIASSAARLVLSGTLLIVVKSKVLMHTLPVAMTTVEVCHNQDIKAIEPNECIDSYFLWHLLKYNQPKLLEQARGANTEGLTLDMLYGILVPNVSLPQQREFAEVVLNHQKSQAQQHESARQTEHLFQTLLHRAFRGEV